MTSYVDATSSNLVASAETRIKLTGGRDWVGVLAMVKGEDCNDCLGGNKKAGNDPLSQHEKSLLMCRNLTGWTMA